MNRRSFYEFDEFILDAQTKVLLKNAEIVRLPLKTVEILLILVRNAGQAVEKEDLLKDVWPDTFVEENNLAHHISVLRKTLGNDRGGRAYIETIPKRGYRFVGKAHELSDPPAAPVRRGIPRRLTLTALALPVTGIAVAVWRMGGCGFRRPLFDSLAVLPFNNFSGDPKQEYISDGLTESLIGAVAKIEGLRVISRTSVMRYKGDRKPLPEIARELDAGAIIEGSVAQFGDRLRVTIQLLNGPRDQHIWSETYERSLAEIPQLWMEVAAVVAAEVRARVRAQQGEASLQRAPNRQAFEAYLRGRYYWNKRTLADIRKAITCFREAIDADPVYAPAYAGLADAYNQFGTVMIGGSSPAETRPLAAAAARRAIEIDPALAEAHAAFAYTQLYDWEWAAAEEGLKRSIRLNPNYAPAHLWYAHYLSTQKRHDEALREVSLASRLDPLSPILRTQTGWILQHAHRHDEAIAVCRKVLESDPDYLWAMWTLGGSYTATSRFPEAIQILERATELSSRSPSILGALAKSYGLAGRKGDARRILEELLVLGKRQYVPFIALVHAYIGLDDTDKVFESLEQAYQRRENGIAWLAVWEHDSRYRRDPRFRALMQRVGLPGD